MLHPKSELLEVLPLLGLLTIVHHDVWLLWRRRTSKADSPRAPVLELFPRMLLYALDELLHRLDRASVAQEQVDQGRESPVLLNRTLGPGLVSLTDSRCPGPIILASSRHPSHILPWPSTP